VKRSLGTEPRGLVLGVMDPPPPKAPRRSHGAGAGAEGGVLHTVAVAAGPNGIAEGSSEGLVGFGPRPPRRGRGKRKADAPSALDPDPDTESIVSEPRPTARSHTRRERRAHESSP